MKKPLSITSPGHAWSLVTYFMLGLTGLSGVLSLNKQSGVIAFMGEGVADVWSTTLMLAGWGAFASAIGAMKADRPEVNLKTEMLLCYALFFNLVFFFYVVLTSSGLKGLNTALFTLLFIVGSVFRAWQIKGELRLIKAARAHPSEADPVMGDPRDDDRG